MKPRRDITPYMHSTSIEVNASLTLLRVYKRLRSFDPTYKPRSHYQARLKNKRAWRRLKRHTVR